jgi:Recombinase
MGRLTLNVLLSFAQFERGVIGERVRDKIAASKRKGLWVGGPVPLGYRCLEKKLEIVPEEAEAVRTIFSLYLELGSMGALMAELDRRNIQTKVNGRRDGRQSGGIRFGVGPLAHLLKNRFYIGEVTYRGEVYRGEHEAILSRDLFDAVQEKLAANAVARQVRLRGSDALLTGRLFDDRGNRMSPTHANKKGARYRYYVSQALLQNRKAEAGSIARVPAPETEKLVCDGLRRHLAGIGKEPPTILTDRELIERHVARVVVKSQTLNIGLIPTSEAQTENPSLTDSAPNLPSPAMIALPWTAPIFAAMKGIVHEPGAKPTMKPESRDALLSAIAKARGWIDDVRLGRIASFAGIAEREAVGERHIRVLALSPSCRLASSQRSPMAQRRPISRSPASPKHCLIPGPSRSGRSCEIPRLGEPAGMKGVKAEAGSIARVPAPEIETLVCDSVRRHLAAMGEAELPGDGSKTSGSAALAPSPRLPSVRPRANGISACWLLSPSCRPGSLRRSSMAPRLGTTVTGVAKALPYSWIEQEERVGLSL